MSLFSPTLLPATWHIIFCRKLAGFDAIGPILLGLSKPVHILQLGSQVRSIFNMVLIAVVDAQMKCKNKNGAETITFRQVEKA